VLDHQREDGMIPDAIHDEGTVTQWKLPNSDKEVEVTKPPLLAWTALKLYQSSGNRDFLDEVYEPVQRWNRCWFEKNDDYEYYHPETGDPPPNAASVFGWSSAVFVDLAIKASRGEIV
jgi:hypothetical protein